MTTFASTDTREGRHRGSTFTYDDAAILSVEAVDAPEVVTSDWVDDQLESVYARTGLRRGMLFRLAGIDSRRWWPDAMTFDAAAADAGHQAIAAAGIDAADVDMLISSSVSRHHLEPSVAASVHHRLGLRSGCLNFDVSNACLGFLNAMQIASSAIDTGAIETALIVNAEGSRQLQSATIDRLCRHADTAADVFAEFASLTLGSGAAAMVLGRSADHSDAHRIIGGTTRAGSEHHRLCVGDLTEMHTDSGALLTSGLELVEMAWDDAQTSFDWADLDHYVIHQISKVHTRLVIDRLGLCADRLPLTFPELGNVGPAAVPITLARHQPNIRTGDRVLCMGVGSGLNTCYLELAW